MYHHDNETKNHGSDEQDVQRAIDESVETGKPVVLDHTDARAAHLFEACESEVPCSGGTRYSGSDLDRRHWVVILND